MQNNNLDIHRASAEDLAAINRVVERAVMGWHLPERVKRLALPTYRYSELDMTHMQLWIAETGPAAIAGVIAWEQADVQDTPGGQHALLIHGIYVDPACQRSGIGSKLLQSAEAAASQAQLNGLLVKAQSGAAGFFHARGYRRLPVTDDLREYNNRFWKTLRGRTI